MIFPSPERKIVMYSLESALQQLQQPILWWEGSGQWSPQWDILRDSVLVQRHPVNIRPQLPWNWTCEDSALRGIQTKSSGCIWFWGEPFGQEQAAIYDILLMAGRGHTRLSPDSESRIKTLTHPVEIDILTTPG